MRLLPAALVFGAAGAGYVYTHDDLSKALSPRNWVSVEGEEPFVPKVDAEQLADAPPESILVVAGPSDLKLEDVFRFDLTPRAITDRWNRVSTGMGDVRYQGYRVPLVTGPSPSDLAGSLTYYFDAQPKLRKITFLGTTGDPARVVEFFSRAYGFKRHQTGNPRVTSYRAHYRHAGLLAVTPAEVLDRSQSEVNYQIEVSLEK
jgi:hypothetical protein